MPSTDLQHRRTHNLLLISKLLSQRDGASPFTLILDDLEQSGRPLLVEYIERAHASKAVIIFLSFETLRRPDNAHHFVDAWNQPSRGWQNEVAKHVKSSKGQRVLLVIDSLNTLSTLEHETLPAVLSSFIGPTSSLLGIYHTDMPPSSRHMRSGNDYAPLPLTLLQYLATTVLTTQSLPHVLARKAARERSLAEPSFGLQESADGIIQGMGANPVDGVVFEMEHRRKSGRGVREIYFLPIRPITTENPAARSRERMILLQDHPLYRSRQATASDGDQAADDTTDGSTFELGLTERQRRDREAVVLPYFDAQKGSGEGGRILYDMGEEDDFDEEEDEI